MLTITEILAGKTEEDKKKEEIQAELTPFGRLRINGPIYADFNTFKRIEALHSDEITAERANQYTYWHFFGYHQPI